MIQSRKTKKKMEVINSIVETLTDKKIYDTLYYQNKSESFIKSYMYQCLLKAIKKLYMTQSGFTVESNAEKKAEESLLYEGDKRVSIHSISFLGTSHRPDFVLKFGKKRYAIEIKKGDIGVNIREGIGQSIIYTTYYDFCVYVFIDTSRDKSILKAFEDEKEKEFIEQLLDQHNIMFAVV